MSRRDCRRQMHFAEHLARQGAKANRIFLIQFELAYLSPNCERRVAQRIHAALDLVA
jgi:hypothetical protein